jgi:hypothetical protein
MDYWDWWIETDRERVEHGVMEMREITVVPEP